MSFLYEIFNNPFARKALALVDIPIFITDNLSHTIRPYQAESFKRFLYLDTEEFEDKPNKPLHLLYNMATGSGKTLVMAGLMLYLYEKGYRNFLFFVNSDNIIKKTKENFLNPHSSKYLFSNKIVVHGNEIKIKEINNFEEADSNNININFTTIHQLHYDLNNTKENSVTYEDLKSKKIVLIADEAHHLSSSTKNSGTMFGSWESTVMEILAQNYDNILLEFTATLDYDSKEILTKYRDKVLFKYDLAQFRIDKYSKEINLIRSEFGQNERILQALILNLYRQDLANSNNINLKPVILFKAKKTIKESEENKQNFHHLIDSLSAKLVDEIRNNSTVHIVIQAFLYFDNAGITSNEIAKRLQVNFKEQNCISANDDKEIEKTQIKLNTLEEENNPIRAVFAVQKLNEGWDVLNLFDIVRLYEGQNSFGSNKTFGSTTLSEAQLIGRGARYFPFSLEEGQDKYTRKYDNDPNNDLKILEELYYHTKEDSKYIYEIKRALIESGIYEDEDKSITKQLSLKLSFKETDFYQTGQVIFNRKQIKSYNRIKSFADLGVVRKNIEYRLSSGAGKMSSVFISEEEITIEKTEQKDISVKLIPNHIIRYALSQNPFFYYNSIVNCFPNINSLTNFINSSDYLGGLEIIFRGTKSRIKNITNRDYLNALQLLLQTIESEIKSHLIEYEGSEYSSEFVHNVFKDKELKLYRDDERADGQENVVANESWYAYNANYGTSEEKKFVELFSRKFESLKQKFDNIYLIRNERTIKIIDKLGRAFEPDFILFCKQKNAEEITYQVFIEPKGNHLIGHDTWKKEFLQKISLDKVILKIHSDHYLITAVPFYNYDNENEFKKTLEDTVK
jgi:type III restriction enzyme